MDNGSRFSPKFRGRRLFLLAFLTIGFASPVALPNVKADDITPEELDEVVCDLDPTTCKRVTHKKMQRELNAQRAVKRSPAKVRRAVVTFKSYLNSNARHPALQAKRPKYRQALQEPPPKYIYGFAKDDLESEAGGKPDDSKNRSPASNKPVSESTSAESPGEGASSGSPDVPR